MNTKHTPTPWQVDPNYPCDIQDQSGKIEVGWIYAHATSGNEEVVGQFSAPPREEAIANCAFIVRAVNAHDDLVAALKMTERLLKPLIGPEHIEWVEMQAITAALAKAEAA